jgi:hypothetical protein
MELKKWEEKKKEMEQLYEDANQPKIKPGDFSGLVKCVKKFIGDSMIAVSHSAIRVCGNLAKGLKKDFEPQCKELIIPLLGRFKEKKTIVVDDTRLVLDSFMLCTTIEVLKDDLIASGLQDKAPIVKRQVCSFLEQACQKTYIDVLQRVSGEFLASLIKLSEDPDGDVRNAALQCLGAFKGRLGESAMSNYLKDMNPQKLAKVNESAKQVQPSKYDRPEKKAEAPPPAKKGPPALG